MLNKKNHVYLAGTDVNNMAPYWSSWGTCVVDTPRDQYGLRNKTRICPSNVTSLDSINSTCILNSFNCSIQMDICINELNTCSQLSASCVDDNDLVCENLTKYCDFQTYLQVTKACVRSVDMCVFPLFQCDINDSTTMTESTLSYSSSTLENALYTESNTTTTSYAATTSATSASSTTTSYAATTSATSASSTTDLTSTIGTSIKMTSKSPSSCNHELIEECNAMKYQCTASFLNINQIQNCTRQIEECAALVISCKNETEKIVTLGTYLEDCKNESEEFIFIDNNTHALVRYENCSNGKLMTFHFTHIFLFTNCTFRTQDDLSSSKERTLSINECRFPRQMKECVSPQFRQIRRASADISNIPDTEDSSALSRINRVGLNWNGSSVRKIKELYCVSFVKIY